MTAPFPLIVLVDDLLEEARLLRRALSAAHVQSTLFPIGTGREALAFFERVGSLPGGLQAPIIAFLNVNMPGTDVFAVLRRVRELPLLHRMPVIMTSESGLARDVKTAAHLGAQCYLVKYPSPPLLGRVITDACAFCSDNRQQGGLFDVPANLLLNPACWGQCSRDNDAARRAKI